MTNPLKLLAVFPHPDDEKSILSDNGLEGGIMSQSSIINSIFILFVV
jgi:hypothetical protein